MVILERFVIVNKFDIVCCELCIFYIHNVLEVHIFTLSDFLLFSFEFICDVMEYLILALWGLKLLLQT
jgi:hypothetical protein